MKLNATPSIDVPTTFVEDIVKVCEKHNVPYHLLGIPFRFDRLKDAEAWSPRSGGFAIRPGKATINGVAIIGPNVEVDTTKKEGPV